ncbi:MAG: hypothetical protein K5766_01980 [Alphaproteobacteria bacterium]|nr:hypothetical protein [Alphaproteobacteria bacterium]
MKKLLLNACLAAAAFWANDSGAMNGYPTDYSSEESSSVYEISGVKELDISSSGDRGGIDVQYLVQHAKFPNVETLIADLRSAFKMIYRSPVVVYAANEQSLIKWNRFPKVKELTLKLDGEFEEVRRSLCETLRYDFGLYTEITEIPQIDTLEELDMSNLDLIAIPESIQNLSNLRLLDLSNNSLEKLPESIGDLRNLELLDLSNNSFTKLPESIGNLTKLKSLNLGANDDNENGNCLMSLPDSMGNLENLEELNLTACSISEIPDHIGNLKNLKTLILEFNPLLDLPDSIGNLVNLETLDLTDCPVQKVPESIGNLKNLKYFYLNDDVILPPTVRNLEKLEPGRLKELEKQIKDESSDQ